MEMNNSWENFQWEYEQEKGEAFHEASLLKLNCDKALVDLDWTPTLDFRKTVEMTVDWYKTFYQNDQKSMQDFSINQIDEYMDLAFNKKNQREQD